MINDMDTITEEETMNQKDVNSIRKFQLVDDE